MKERLIAYRDSKKGNMKLVFTPEDLNTLPSDTKIPKYDIPEKTFKKLKEWLNSHYFEVWSAKQALEETIKLRKELEKKSEDIKKEGL